MAALRAASFVAGLVPEVLVRSLAGVFGWVWFVLLRYRREVILENLGRAFPDASAAERRSLGVAACRHLLLAFAEFFRIPRYRRIGLERVVEIRGIEHFDAAKAKGKGVLCVSGHLGSFELCVAAVARRAAPVNLVVKPFRGAFEAFASWIRQGSGLGLIPADGAIRPILKALGRNEAVVFVLDQNATRKIGVFVDFFGEPACTMSALALIALRTGAPVIAAIPKREGRGHVLEVLPEIPMDEQGSREQTVRHMTRRYTRVIEDAIRASPEQWFWTHKRWRTRPEA
jgi:KDO2-lipid IV(A) lauroyltransferase